MKQRWRMNLILIIVIIGYLHINSIRDKFEILQFLLADYSDILMISENKLDGTFPSL